MKWKIFFIFSFYCLLYVTVFANSSTRPSTRFFREPGNDQNSNWSIHYAFGKGNPKSDDLSYTNSEFVFLGNILDDPALTYLGTRKISPNIESYNARFLAEYLPNHFGFQFGMNYNSINVTYKDNTLALGTLLLFQSLSSSANNLFNNTTSNNTTNSINPSSFVILPLLFSSITQNINFSTHVTTLDFASTIHFLPRKTFDPYLNLGIGIGTCGYACSSGKIFGRLGARVNMGGGYIFLESEYSETVVRPAGSPNSVKLNDSLGLFGFGLYL